MAAGVCGTDLHIKSGEWPLKKVPIVIGHEFCGEVSETGSSVKGLKKGELVVAEPYIDACGHCEYCFLDLNICVPIEV